MIRDLLAALGAAVLAVAIYLGLDFLGAWWVMLTLGWAHSCDIRVPAFGYWASFWLMCALGTPVALASASALARKD